MQYCGMNVEENNRKHAVIFLKNESNDKNIMKFSNY